MQGALDQVRAKDWFYEFELPDGTRTESYLPETARAVHTTRLAMMWSALEPLFDGRWSEMSALDLACHQGWFAGKLAEKGCRQVTGIDARAAHVEDAALMARALGQEKTRYVQCAVEELDRHQEIEPADIVLMFGLIYHLENPVGAVRAAHAYCRKMCLIETQVGPHLSGMLDWGNHEFVRPIQGCFSIIDETGETHAGEAGTTGICLAPSAETLLWLMRKVGFRDVALVPAPDDGYEQHRHGKRVMAAGFV